MFTVWYMFRDGVNIICSVLYTNILNVHCFAYIAVSGYNMFSFIYQYLKNSLFHIYSLVGVNNMPIFYTAIFYMFTFSHISLYVSRKTIYAFLLQYLKCLLFRIYSLVMVNNMCTFMQQYFKCSPFRIYRRVWVNNMCTFIAIFKMLTISRMFPCWGR